MKTATVGVTARHSHLLRAAQCAGEAFAYSLDDGPARSRSLGVWIGIGAFAALVLFVAF